MKRIIVLFIACFMSIASFSQGYIINAKVKGVKGGWATLRTYFKDGNEKVDSTQIDEKGNFSLRGNVKEPIPALLTINGKRSYRIYLEEATYKLTLDPASIEKSKFEGSKYTTKWYELINSKKNEDYEVHLRRLENWVINNPDDIFCADIISSFLSFSWDYTELSKTLNTLQKNAQHTYHYVHLKQREEALGKLAVGEIAPDFTMATPKGDKINLYNYLRGKKYVLLDFWASWCKPCREENPNVVKAYEKYHDLGFDILGVSLDKDKASWEAAIKADNLSWGHVSDLKFWDNEVSKLYLIRSIPANLLLDSKGKIIARNLRAEELLNKLAQLTSSYGYSIEGEIGGIKEGIIKMDILLENGEKQTQSTEIKHGKFVFTGMVDNICMGNIILPSKNGEISFFLENSQIKITGSKEDLDKVQIKGSNSNDEFIRLANQCNGDKNPMQCLMNEVLKDPTTIYAPLLVSSYLAPYLSIIDLKELVAKLDGDAKTMYQYKLLSDFVAAEQKKEGLGETAIDFTLSDTKGYDVQLSQFLKGKKYVLIDFWASWCVPCKAESKYLLQAYKKYHSSGFDILGVSLDDDRQSWLKAIKEEGRNWTNVSDLNRWNGIIAKLYKLESIPQNILVNEKGEIIAKNLKGDNLLTTLLQLFAK